MTARPESRRRTRRAVVAAIALPLVVGITAPPLAVAQGTHGEAARSTEPAASPLPARLLDVPYVPQSEALCGGAAVAMVMRYWGARDVYAEDFAPYVSDARGGILTDVLADAAGRFGWSAHPFRSDLSDVRHHLDRGRPLIALIRVARDRFHYIVIVGLGDGEVVYHDPAVAPYRTTTLESFARDWIASNRWAMLLLPPTTNDPPEHEATAVAAGTRQPASPTPREASVVAHPESIECGAMVRRGIEHARADDLEAAERELTQAAEVCLASPSVARELGGLRFRQGRFPEAVRLAERATVADPTDDYAWELLAASRFRTGDHSGALAAWNRVGRPRIDLVEVAGLRRTRHRVIARRLELASGATLTPARLARAEKRLAALPTVRASAVRYRPNRDGSVEVEAAVVERPLIADGWIGLASLGARALPERELIVPVASPTGAGALLELRWRWWENRPLFGAELAVPNALGLPGVLALEGLWERQAYVSTASDALADTIAEERRHAAARISEWLSGSVRVVAGLGVDRWGEGPLRPTANTGADIRFADDRLAITLGGAGWPAISGRDALATFDLDAFWRSSGDAVGTQWRGRVGVALASPASSLGLRPGAGTGHARRPLLRAHPLLVDGMIRRERIGRALLHGGAEITRWLATWGPAAAGVAVFLDGAKLSSHGGRPVEAPFMLDAGLGLRLALPWEGRLRADFGLGLRDGATAFSLGWEEVWPASRGAAR